MLQRTTKSFHSSLQSDPPAREVAPRGIDTVPRKGRRKPTTKWFVSKALICTPNLQPPLETIFPLLLTLVLALAAAACPPDGPITADTYAVGCADLRLTVVAENVTLVIEGATGSINVTSDAPGTTLRLLHSTVTGNVTLRGPHAFADVRHSTVSGVDVVVLSGPRNATIAVVDSTLTGAVVASVLSSAIGVTIAIANSTLSASRYVVSVVGGTIRDLTIFVAASRLALAGGDNVGIVALTGTVINAAVNFTSSSLTCKAGTYVGVLGAGIGSGVTWTNVTVSARLANVTSTASEMVGVLGVGSGGKISWTNVTFSAVLVTVTSATSGTVLGVLGAASYSGGVIWTNVVISAALANVSSISRGGVVGVFGTGSGSSVTWKNVDVSAGLANILSTANGVAVGILGAGSHRLGVTWTNVTVSVARANVTSIASNYVGVVGAGGGSLTWTNVTVCAAMANITSIASDSVGVFGAGSIGSLTWTNVTVSAAVTNITSTANNYVGVLGSGTGSSAWTNITVSVALANVTSVASNYVGVLGSGTGSLTWTNVTVSVALASNITSTANNFVGVVGTGSNVVVAAGTAAAVATWTDVAILLVDSTLACRSAAVSGSLGASIATFDLATGRRMSVGSVTWRGVVVVAAASVVHVWAGERAAVLGASADGGSWDDVFAGVVEAGRLYCRVGPACFTLGAPGTWRDTVLANQSAAIDANSSVLCSNRTIDRCAAAQLPDVVAVLIERVRRLDLRGRICPSPTEAAAESRTDTSRPTPTPSSTPTPTPSSTPTATIETTAINTTTTAHSTTNAFTPTDTATTVERNTATSVKRPTSTTIATATPTETTTTTALWTTTPVETSTTTTSAPFHRQQQQVEAAATGAAAALGVLTSPLNANKGTTMSRVLAVRECRSIAPEPEAIQFVYVFEVGGSAAAGALTSTLLLQTVVAAVATACASRFPQASVVHLAALSYYGPNVAALATAALCRGDGSVAAVVSLAINASLLGVAVASAWSLAAHHRALWKEARDPGSALVRIYGAVDLASAFAVGTLSGAGGLTCTTRGALMCAACLVNLAHAVLVRPAVRPLDNALAVMTALLVFGLALLSVAAPREPIYDSTVFALAAAVAAWMYLLLALALATAVRRFLSRNAAKGKMEKGPVAIFNDSSSRR